MAERDSAALDSLMAVTPHDLQIRGSFVGCWKDDHLDKERTKLVADNLLYAICMLREMVGSWQERYDAKSFKEHAVEWIGLSPWGREEVSTDG